MPDAQDVTDPVTPADPVAAAHAELAALNYVIGRSNTADRNPEERRRIKAACRVIEDDRQAKQRATLRAAASR